jgi:hypothetical protein
MKKLILIITSLLLALMPVLATPGSDSTSINLNGTVPRNTGVVVPSNVTLVGNLAIAYDYNNTGSFSYVSSDLVRVVDLGVVAGLVVLRADYYGNEPDQYSCNVTFSSEGWKLKNEDTSYTLPILFSVPSTEEAMSGRLNVDNLNPGSFRLTVPVDSPINGGTAAYVTASWAADPYLPSGDYEADIVIEVQSM